MINYSITMRSVNPNMIEINQAKGRIKAAKEANQEPDKADTDLVATEVKRAFAVAQYSNVMTLAQLAKHISSHGCVYSHADIQAILNIAVDCVREQILEGRKIELGDLGNFSVSLSSNGAESAEKFNAQCITGVKVVWEPGEQFCNLLQDAKFNLVPTRSAQNAVLKAIKAGKTVVNLNEDETSGGSTSGATGGDTGGSTTDNPQPATSYKVTVATADASQGSVVPEGLQTVTAGESITITATAEDGYKFKQWSDGDTNRMREYTPTGDITLTASFESE